MDDLAVAVEAARAGAEVVRAGMGRAGRAEYKADASPVTEVDRAAERAVLAILERARPRDAVVAEEGGGGIGADAGRRWFVDPLDGTVNFLSGIPQVGVSVALYDEGGAAAAAVIDVARDETFTARRDGGTFMDDRPVHVSPQGDLDLAVIATGFPYDHRDHAQAYTAVLAGVLARVQGIRRFGSAALDLAWVAAGRFDAFFELALSPWDIAAGLLLISEAGGIVTDERGDPAGPGSTVLVASNGLFHEELRAIVARGVAQYL